MSIKNYYGMIFVNESDETPIENMSVYQLKEMMDLVRQDSHKLLRKFFVEVLSADCVSIIDRMAVDENFRIENNTSVKSYCFTKAIERHKECQRTQRRDPLYDFSFNASVLCTPKKTLLMPFFDRQELYKLLEAKPFLKPYGYWNNTDPEEGVSDEDWEQRGEDWESAWGESGVPAQTGFTVELAPLYPYYPTVPDFDEMKESFPDFEKRKDYLSDYLARIQIAKTVEEREKTEENPKTGYALHKKVMEFAKTDEGKEILEKTKSEVNAKLKEEILPEQLEIVHSYEEEEPKQLESGKEG